MHKAFTLRVSKYRRPRSPMTSYSRLVVCR